MDSVEKETAEEAQVVPQKSCTFNVGIMITFPDNTNIARTITSTVNGIDGTEGKDIIDVAKSQLVDFLLKEFEKDKPIRTNHTSIGLCFPPFRSVEITSMEVAK